MRIGIAITRASNIEVTKIKTEGVKCKGRKARLPICVQEAAYLSMLESADGYVVATDGLSLLRGSRKIAEFEQRREATETSS